MRLDGENATFELNYTLDTFTRFYVSALGCRYLEPELISFLGGYSDVMLIKADIEGAALLVVGAGKYNSGYYISQVYGHQILGWYDCCRRARHNSQLEQICRCIIDWLGGGMGTIPRGQLSDVARPSPSTLLWTVSLSNRWLCFHGGFD